MSTGNCSYLEHKGPAAASMMGNLCTNKQKNVSFLLAQTVGFVVTGRCRDWGYSFKMSKQRQQVMSKSSYWKVTVPVLPKGRKSQCAAGARERSILHDFWFQCFFHYVSAGHHWWRQAMGKRESEQLQPGQQIFRIINCRPLRCKLLMIFFAFGLTLFFYDWFLFRLRQLCWLLQYK